MPASTLSGGYSTGLAATFRTDRWWFEPLWTGIGFLLFVIYANWAAFQGNHYFYHGYLSPFYSPLLFTDPTRPGAAPLEHAWFGSWPHWLQSIWPPFFPSSPAWLILAGPLSFRLTCYYYRKFYYRSYFMTPPACAVGALPWMQNRHLAVGAAFGTAVMVRLLHDSRDSDDGGPAHHRLAVLRSSRFLVPLALMVGLQLGSLLYSWLGIHAFGPSAPPGFMGWYSAMIGLGLHLDRFHGIFFQNPLLFAAIAGLPVFVRRTPTLAILWATVYVLSVVPVCLTRFGYGGWAFAGRYGWDVAPLWIVPFAHFVAWLLEQRRGRAVLAVLLMVSALVQVLLAARWITTDGLLIEGVWRPSMVDGFYGDLSGKLPMFSGLQELLVHRPNWLWVGLALLCLFITRMTRKRWKMSLVVTSAAIVLVGLLLISPSIHRPFEIVGARLPMTTGRNDGSARIAVEGTDAPGFVTFGPYVMLTAGCYELQLSYAAAYPDSTHPLSWDHYSGGQILSQGLVDAAERGTVLRQVVRVPPGDQIDGFELRVWFGGKGRIRIDKLVIVESPAC